MTVAKLLLSLTNASLRVAQEGEKYTYQVFHEVAGEKVVSTFDTLAKQIESSQEKKIFQMAAFRIKLDKERHVTGEINITT